MAPDSMSPHHRLRGPRAVVRSGGHRLGGAPSGRIGGMRLASFLDPPGSLRAGEVRADHIVAFQTGTVADRLGEHEIAPASGEPFALADVTLQAPVPRPRAIFGIGLNYEAHARETGKDLPEQPIVFMKLPSSSAPPGGPVRCPRVVT